jgi:ABC-type polysaccharide/polyol phosphate export permease
MVRLLLQVVVREIKTRFRGRHFLQLWAIE